MFTKLINWLKGNLKDLVDFLKEHGVEIHVKKKTTEEITRTIKINNLFLVFCIVVIIGFVYCVIKFKTIIFP